MVQLNHTIVAARDKERSASFLADVLGLPQPQRFGPFMAVHADNGVTLDFMEADGAIVPQHYAFLVDDREFERVFARVQERGLPYWADPHHHARGQLNRRDGGRGFYFEDPNGHNLEVLTRPYGGH